MLKFFLKSFVVILLLVSSNCFAGVYLDGGAYVTVPDDASIDFTGPDLTVYALVSLDSATSGDFMQNTMRAASSKGFYMCRINTKFCFRVYPAARIDSTSTITANTWYSLVMRLSDTDNEVSAWINGVKDPTTRSYSGNIGDISHALLLGRWDSDEVWEGNIAEVAIWDSALTDDEIILLSDSKMKRLPLQIQPANLKIYLPLNECIDGAVCSGTFKDLSGNDNTGSAVNSPIGVAETVLTYP